MVICPWIERHLKQIYWTNLCKMDVRITWCSNALASLLTLLRVLWFSFLRKKIVLYLILIVFFYNVNVLFNFCNLMMIRTESTGRQTGNKWYVEVIKLIPPWPLSWELWILILSFHRHTERRVKDIIRNKLDPKIKSKLRTSLFFFFSWFHITIYICFFYIVLKSLSSC